jgi:ribonuclease T1
MRLSRVWRPLAGGAGAVLVVLALFGLSIAPARGDDRAAAGASAGALIAIQALPPEARETLALIRKGGPFPHEQDGTVFGNRERLLPRAPRGHYTEYTVRTPGLKHRGARRIVAGGAPRSPQAEFWYTEDHYQSFRRIKE